MRIEEEEYELGKEITHLATGKPRKGTSVVSVRLDIAYVVRLEAIGREGGKTISQVVRDAIAAYKVRQPMMVVSLCSGSIVSTGNPEDVSGTVPYQVAHPLTQPYTTGTTVPMQLHS